MVIIKDPYLPFGVIQIDNRNWQNIWNNYNQLRFVKWDNDNNEIFMKQNVLIVGVNYEGSIASVGKVINSNRNYAASYGSLIQTSSGVHSVYGGSPVFNERGEGNLNI